MIPLGVLAGSRYVAPSVADYRTDIAVVENVYGIVWVGRSVPGTNQTILQTDPKQYGDIYVNTSGSVRGDRYSGVYYSQNGNLIRAALLDPPYSPRAIYVGRPASGTTGRWRGDMRWRVVPSGTTPAEAAAIQDELLIGF